MTILGHSTSTKSPDEQKRTKIFHLMRIEHSKHTLQYNEK